MKGEGARQREVFWDNPSLEWAFLPSWLGAVTVYTLTRDSECNVCFSYTSTLWKAAQGRLGAVDNNMMTRGQGKISTVGTAAETLAMFEFQWPQP